MRDAIVGLIIGVVIGGIAMLAIWPVAGVIMLATPLLSWVIVLGLAKNNILFTMVESGWRKIIMRWNRYEREIGPGLHLLGIPGIHTLYRRKMRFMKSVTDAEGRALVEPHVDEPDVDSFKTTQYPYALPFINEEDSKGLPLSGLLAVFARIVDYRKAFFVVSDWYAEMNTRILAHLRREIANVSYDDDIVGRDRPEERALQTFSGRLWQALNARQNGGLSVIGALREVAGIEVESVVLRSVDPPEDWRATTLAPYKAERDRAAAEHEAAASATRFDDTNQALKVWLMDQRTAGYEPTRAQIEAKQDELRQRALAKTQGYQQVHIKGLENATTAVVGGGPGAGAGILVGNQGAARRSGGNNQTGQGNPQGRRKRRIEDMDSDELEDAAEED